LLESKVNLQSYKIALMLWLARKVTMKTLSERVCLLLKTILKILCTEAKVEKGCRIKLLFTESNYLSCAGCPESATAIAVEGR
jgi:hypothetical protein